MSQSESAALMAQLANESPSMKPRDLMASLARVLDKLRSSIDEADYHELLLIGAAMWRFASMGNDSERHTLAGSGGTG